MMDRENEEFMLALRAEFLIEAAFLMEQCEELCLNLEHSGCADSDLAHIFRVIHTIKGSGGAAGLQDIVAFTHIFEDCLSQLRTDASKLTTEIISLMLEAGDALAKRIDVLRNNPHTPWHIEALQQKLHGTVAILKGQDPKVVVAKMFDPEGHGYGFFEEEEEDSEPITREEPPKNQTLPSESDIRTHKQVAVSVKVDANRIDGILNIVGELVVIKSQLMNRISSHITDQSMNSIASLLDTTIRDLQDKAIGIRMTPLKPLFLKFQRMARDLSIQLQKPIDFNIVGEDTELDRSIVDVLSDPLMHTIRNCIDHGIEKSESRRQSGKNEKGKVSLLAKQEGSRVIIVISDDGGGINCERVVQKAKEQRLIEENAQLTRKEIYQLIFRPGFSTAATVSEVSGRGVGMDVVKTNIEKLKGSIDIDSVEGKGTAITISIPLTTAITDGLLVKVLRHFYVIPMDGIREIVKIESNAITKLSDRREVINVRGSLQPIISLKDIMLDRYLTQTSQDTSATLTENLAVVMEHGPQLTALRVSEVLGQVQIVLKPLSNDFRNLNAVAGAGILGDGRAVLVLDINGVVTCAQEAKRPQEIHKMILRAG